MSDGRLYIAVDLGAGSGRVILAGFQSERADARGGPAVPLPAAHGGRAPSLGRAPHPVGDHDRASRSGGARARAEPPRPQHRHRLLGRGLRPARRRGASARGSRLLPRLAHRRHDGRGVRAGAEVRGVRADGHPVHAAEHRCSSCSRTCARACRRATARLLLVPDLIGAQLSGRQVTEFSIGTTTQMFDAAAGTWDRELLGRLGIPTDLLCDVVPSGTTLGPLLPDVAAETGLDGVHVVVPAAHDTGSAVAGAPLQPGWAYISSGTWSLAGVERTGVLDQRRGRAPQLHERGRRVRHDPVPQERDGAVDPRVVPARVEGRGARRSTTTTCCSAAAAIEGEPGLIYPDDSAVPEPAEHAGRHRRADARDGPGGAGRTAGRRQGDPRLARAALRVGLLARSRR